MVDTFQESVRRSFDSALKPFDMNCTVATTRQVRYESDNTFLVVHYDNDRSFELGIEYGLNGRAVERPFNLQEVLRFKGAPMQEVKRGFVATTPPQINDNIERMSDLTFKYCADLLSGNELTFAALARFRERESDQYILESRLRSAIASGRGAWEKKDWAGVVRSLDSLEQHLTKAEKRRLEYARRKLGTQT